ncbi:MAG TPA: hypothetical protein ENI15_10945 [Spirochaetes bacterium]|nr:hypothetical protein [Spirochaetota bacterium]
MERMELKDMVLKDPRKILDIIKKGEKRSIVEELWAFAMDEGEPKPVKKAVKKALYIIKSNGIDVDIYRPEPDQETRDVKEESAVHSVLASIPDSEGHNVLVFAVTGSGETRFDILKFLIGPDRCIYKYSAYRGSKKYFEKFKAENPAFFPLPADYGLLRLNRALEKTEIKKISGLSVLPRVLVMKEEKEVRHPVFDFVPVSVSRIVNPEDERNLFKMWEIGGLVLPENEIEVFKGEIEAAKQSRLIVMGKSPEERVKAAITKVYSVYFTAERRAVYRDMLLDIGLYFYYNGHAEYSRILIGWADRLLNINLKAADHPFLSYLVYKAFMLK